MAEITFSDDPNDALNKKVAELGSVVGYEAFQSICREIYKMGFDDGQTDMWVSLREMAAKAR